MNKYSVGVFGFCMWFGDATFFVSQVEAKVITQTSAKVSRAQTVVPAPPQATAPKKVALNSKTTTTVQKTVSKPVSKKVTPKKVIKKYKNGTSPLLSAPLVDPNNPPGGR